MNHTIAQNIKTAVLILLLGVMMVPFAAVHAQDEAPVREYTLLEPLPCVDANAANCENNVVKKVDLVRYLNIMFKLAIGLAGVFAVLMIVVGGFQYATTDAIFEKKEGKERIKNAIEGLLLALVSYFILYTIDPRFVQFRTDLEPLGIQEDANVDEYLSVTLGNIAKQARTKLEELDFQAAELRKKAVEAETEEEAVDFLIQADTIEREAIRLRVDTLADQNRKNALEKIKNADLAFSRSTKEIGNLESSAEESVALFRDNLTKNYDEAINALRRKGDIEGASRYVALKTYDQFTIEAELISKEAVLYAQTADHIDDKNHVEKIVEVLRTSKDNFTQQVNDPDLREKYISESNERINRIREAQGKQTPTTW